MKDPYKILGVSPDSSEEQIRSAYRKLAKELHPDRFPNDLDAQKKFLEVQDAYETIINKRRPFKSYQKKQILKGSVLLDFEDSFFGGSKKIQFNYHVPCNSCQGTGASETAKCPLCNGYKMVSFQQGNITFTTTCRNCSGRGFIVNIKCSTCNGTCVDKKTKEVEINIPVGIHSNDVLRIESETESYYIYVNVKPHKYFQRSDNNLLLVLPICYTTAVLGGEIEVPTMKNPVVVKIPPKSKAGSEIKLHGYGFKDKGIGDLIIKLDIDVDPHENCESLLNQLSQIERVYPGTFVSSFREKVNNNQSP